jgi:epsilon-lactone hydrolase
MLFAGVLIAILAVALAGVALASRRQGVSIRAWGVTRLLPILYGSSNDPAALYAEIEKDRRRGPALPPASLQREFHIRETISEGGRRFELSTHADRRKGPHILYFHGGAYVMQLIAPQWTLIGGLVRRTGGTATVALYPLAPEHDWRQGLDAADKAFDELAEKVGAANIVVAGDSAGGGLTLALALKRRDEGKPLPVGLVLFSPWLDITVSGADQPQLEKRDPSLNIPMLRRAGDMWARDTDRVSPYVSPLFGEQEGLPPTLVFSGTRDLLFSDARRLVEKAPHVRLVTYPEMFHVWMAAPIPEAGRALDQAAAFMAEVTRSR